MYRLSKLPCYYTNSVTSGGTGRGGGAGRILYPLFPAAGREAVNWEFEIDPVSSDAPVGEGRDLGGGRSTHAMFLLKHVFATSMRLLHV